MDNDVGLCLRGLTGNGHVGKDGQLGEAFNIRFRAQLGVEEADDEHAAGLFAAQVGDDGIVTAGELGNGREDDDTQIRDLSEDDLEKVTNAMNTATNNLSDLLNKLQNYLNDESENKVYSLKKNKPFRLYL